jgi:hypothetical protein
MLSTRIIGHVFSYTAFIVSVRKVYSVSRGWKDRSYFLSTYAYSLFLESKSGRMPNSVFEWQQATEEE